MVNTGSPVIKEVTTSYQEFRKSITHVTESFKMPPTYEMSKEAPANIQSTQVRTYPYSITIILHQIDQHTRRARVARIRPLAISQLGRNTELSWTKMAGGRGPHNLNLRRVERFPVRTP
ncbi:hypothetical protein E4U59_004075 [Claviceps monticola]|nr:hypothetical protein E4U59_004075 [Claviceps monticola]